MGAFEFGLSDGCHCEQSCLSLFHKKKIYYLAEKLRNVKSFGVFVLGVGSA